MLVRAGKWLAGRILRLLPESLVGRLLPGEYRFDLAELPAPVAAPDARIRVFIAPTNYAGQGWQWGRALERSDRGVGARNMVCRRSDDFAHPADNVVGLGFYAASRTWQRAQREAVAKGFTHVLVESERRPFGAVLDESLTAQVRWLLRRGLKVAMVCHGTDIRLPSRHAARDPYSPFLHGLRTLAPTLERTAARNRRILDRLGLPVFVTTPDLVLDVPHAAWLPSIVDTGLWRSAEPVLERAVPVVAHVPGKVATKGTDRIDPLMRRLEAEGVISYRRLSGVPFARMPQVIRDADVIIDQLGFGDYGVAGIEGMCAGRLVVSYISEHTRGFVESSTGRRLPIVTADRDSLETVVRGIIADRERFRGLAREGAEFVSEVHDGRFSAAVLRGFVR